MTKKEKLIELKAQYRVLSELTELWGAKTSKHRAYLVITNKMLQIAKEIILIET